MQVDIHESFHLQNYFRLELLRLQIQFKLIKWTKIFYFLFVYSKIKAFNNYQNKELQGIIQSTNVLKMMNVYCIRVKATRCGGPILWRKDDLQYLRYPTLEAGIKVYYELKQY